MKQVDNGPVDDLPSVLQCGECGTRTGGITWQFFADEDGELLGASGITRCRKCGGQVVGLLAQDPAVMEAMRLAAIEAFGD